MKFKNTISLLFLVITTISGYAQTKSIRGRIVNNKGEKIEQATISLKGAKDSILVKGTATDVNGGYVLENVPQGEYVIHFSHMGYGPVFKDVIFKEKDIVVEDIILPFSSTIKIEEVNVKKSLPLIVRKIDKIMVNIEGSVYERGENGLRLLNVIPEINVVGRDINFRGSEGVTIYLDNRRLQLSGDQLITFLRNIPSESIKSYELKTVPGAENDGQHAGVIVNIVLKNEYKFGLSGNISSGYWYNGENNANVSSQINYRKNKVTLEIGGNYFNSPSFYTDQATIDFKETGIKNKQEEKYFERYNSYGINAGLDYSLTEKQTIGFDYNLYSNPGNLDNSTTTITSFLSNTNNLDSTLTSYKRGNFQFTSQIANAFYRNKLDTVGSRVDVGYSFVRYSLNHPSSVETILSKGDKYTNTSNNLFMFNDGSSNTHVFNIDLEKILSPSMTISAGSKYTIATTNYLMEYRNGLNAEAPLDGDRSNDYKYNEDILAFYATLSKSFKPWSVKVGLRAEQTTYDGNSSNGNQKIEKKHWDLFPSAYLNRKIGDSHSLTLSYARRINRPRFRELNPFTFYTSSVSIQEGNPNLLPYFGNNIQLEYLFKGKYSFTTGYQSTKNAMATQIRSVNSVLISREENISDNNNFFVSTYIPIRIASWWNLNLSGTLRNTQLDIQTDPAIHRSKFSKFARATSRFTLPKEYMIELSGFTSRNNFYEYYDAHNVNRLDIFIKKSFFNNKLSTNLEMCDPFHLFKPGQNINTPTFVKNVSRTRVDYARYIGIWLTYNFSGGKKSSDREGVNTGGNEARGRM